LNDIHDGVVAFISISETNSECENVLSVRTAEKNLN